MAGKYRGAIAGLTGTTLHGWVWNSEASDERVVLEFFLDGHSLGIACANVYENRLYREGIGDGVHGFLFELPDRIPETGGTVRARIANTSHWLDSSFDLEKDEQVDRLHSSIFTDGGLRVTGWALQLANTDEPVSLRFATEKGDTWKQVADRFSQYAPAETPYCGFDFTLPLEYADGEKHTLSIVTEQGEALKASPLTVVCHPQGEADFFAKHVGAGLPENVARPFVDLLEANSPYSPKSVGFAHYPTWFELFGAPRHRLRRRQIRFGLRWVGEGDRERTKASMQAQTYRNYSWSEYGKYVALVGAGDTLPPWALAAVAEAIAPDTGILYTDCDTDGKKGERSDPWFKPAWDPDLFCQQNLLSPLCIVEAGIYGKFAAAPTEAIPYLAAQYCMERGKAIRHLPLMCYHRRCELRNWDNPDALLGFRRFRRWKSPIAEEPLVSIVIPTRDREDYLKTCIESVYRGNYLNIEVLVVDNQSRDRETLEYFDALKRKGVKIVPYDAPFNFSALNNRAVDRAGGEVICLLNNDVEVVSPEWLEEMLALLLREDTGIVGAKLLWPNRMVQHGGVLLGLNNVAGHYGNRTLDDDGGYYDQNQTVRRVSAVTAACLLIRKADFQKAGGLNEIDFPVTFNDVDLCLRVKRQLGKNTVWTPRAKLFHDESVSRGKEDSPEKIARATREIQALRRIWGEQMLTDIAYNPSLCLDAVAGAHGGLALPPRPRRVR